MDLNLGPISLRLYSGQDRGKNWTHLEAAWVTNRNGGKARRETAVAASFKSEHLIDVAGKDNPADTFTCPDTGAVYYGKIVQTPSGIYAVSATDVYTKALYQAAVKTGLTAAESATAKIAPTAEPVTAAPSGNGKAPDLAAAAA
jgi:hypothetical protein